MLFPPCFPAITPSNSKKNQTFFSSKSELKTKTPRKKSCSTQRQNDKMVECTDKCVAVISEHVKLYENCVSRRHPLRMFRTSINRTSFLLSALVLFFFRTKIMIWSRTSELNGSETHFTIRVCRWGRTSAVHGMNDGFRVYQKENLIIYVLSKIHLINEIVCVCWFSCIFFCCWRFKGDLSVILFFFLVRVVLLLRCHSNRLSHSQYLVDSFFVGCFVVRALHRYVYLFLVRSSFSLRTMHTIERKRSLFFGPKSNLNTCASSKRNWNPQRV